MAYIKVIHPNDATGDLEALYRLVRGPGGQVDQVLQIHSLRPHTLKGHMALYKATLHDTRNTLPVWYLECIGVLVSRLNACGYCDVHHSTGLKRQLRREKLDYQQYDRAIDRVLAGDESAPPLTRMERAGLDYAIKLTRSPGDIDATDIDRLRDAGLSDGRILEINQVTGYFAYANRTVTGLGVSTEGEELGLAPPESEDGSDWHHE
jgi:uncharacterized peroxidase-related enzyme